MNWNKNSKWIWVDNAPIPNSYGEFYTTFRCDGGNVQMLISVDTNYALYVNGTFVDAGQYPDFPYYKVFDKLDISAYCKQGENKLALQVWYMGDYGQANQTYYPAEAGVRFEIYENERLLAYSDANVTSRLSKTYQHGFSRMLTPQLGPSYCYDATKADNWVNGELQDFTASAVFERDLPLFERPVAKLRNEAAAPSTLIKTAENYALFDLGREEVGYLTLQVNSAVPQKLVVAYGEHIVDGCVRRKIGERDFSFDVIVPAGKTTFTGYFRRLGLRYLEVHSEAAVDIDYATVLPCPYPFNFKRKTFKNELHQRIYDMSARTLELCFHDHYEDCPWREQALYAMDSRNQMLCGYYAFKEFAAPRASLLLFSKDHRDDGILSICAPMKMNLTIPSFSLHYFTEVYEYTKYSGDLTLIKEILPKLRSVLDAFLSKMENGLIPNFKEWYHWNFYEWTDGMNGTFGTDGKLVFDAALNCLLSYTLQTMQKICDLAGEKADFAEKAKTLNARIHETFFKEKTGLFSMYPDTESYKELVNALAVLCGAATEQEAAYICDVLAGENDMPSISLSMNCFKYDALLQVDKAKYRDYILSDIETKYKRMLDAGATTFWETEDGEKDFGNAGSLCHGWSAMPIYYFDILDVK